MGLLRRRNGQKNPEQDQVAVPQKPNILDSAVRLALEIEKDPLLARRIIIDRTDLTALQLLLHIGAEHLESVWQESNPEVHREVYLLPEGFFADGRKTRPGEIVRNEEEITGILPSVVYSPDKQILFAVLEIDGVLVYKIGATWKDTVSLYTENLPGEPTPFPPDFRHDPTMFDIAPPPKMEGYDSYSWDLLIQGLTRSGTFIDYRARALSDFSRVHTGLPEDLKSEFDKKVETAERQLNAVGYERVRRHFEATNAIYVGENPEISPSQVSVPVVPELPMR